MTAINRREMITGAAALLGSAHLPFTMAAQQVGAAGRKPVSVGLPEKPKDLFVSTFTPEMLSRTLISAKDWHPYPKAAEREAWQQVPKEFADALIARAEKATGAPWESFPASVFLEYKRNGNRSHFERYYFARRTRLGDLVLGECIEGKGRFLDEMVNGIWLECEETFWGLPAHLGFQKVHPSSGLPDVEEPIVDLFTGDTGSSMSWIHYLLGAELDKVNPMITPRIRYEVKRRLLDPAFTRDDFGWMFHENQGQVRHLGNWTSWIDSNWLTANLLLEPDPERRKAAILKICRSVDDYLKDYSPDACCAEGPGYWNVSPGSYFDCCTLLHSATGGAGDPLADPFVHKMLHYIVDVHIAGPFFVNYGDAPSKMDVYGENLFRIGAMVGDKILRDFGALNTTVAGVQNGVLTEGQGRLARSIPDIFIASAALAAEKNDALGRDSWYPSLDLMTARTREGSAEGFYLAMQAAPNQRAHGHNDSGSFIVFHDGDPVFVDIGPEAYTAARYKFSVQSAYHNLPTVGGVMQSAAKPEYRASDGQYSADDSRATVTMNLGTAYPQEAGIIRWIRTLTLDRMADRIRLSEDFQLQKKVPVQLSFMTPRIPTQGPQGKVVLIAAGKSTRDVTLSYDATLIVPAIEKIDLTDDWLVERWGKTIYRVLLTSVAPTESGKWVIELA
ncbi:MAG: heparinase II/III family protein [Terracidiphilus sp.]